MKVQVLNGSPREKGTVATLLKAVVEGINERHDVEWIDVYDLKMKPCIACMKCRPDGECVQPEYVAHIIGRKIKDADALIIGTLTHWGNMSEQLKLLFDRNVPVFMGEKPNGFPNLRQKEKPVANVTACTTPWPFKIIAAESRGAIRAVREVLHYGGYKIIGKVVKPETRKSPEITQKLLDGAKNIGARF